MENKKQTPEPISVEDLFEFDTKTLPPRTEEDGELITPLQRMKDLVQIKEGTGWGATNDQTWIIQEFIAYDYFRNKGLRLIAYRLYTLLFVLQALYPQHFEVLAHPGVPHLLWVVAISTVLLLAQSEAFLANFMHGQNGAIEFATQFLIPGIVHREAQDRKKHLQRAIENLKLQDCDDYSEKDFLRFMRSHFGLQFWKSNKSKKRD